MGIRPLLLFLFLFSIVICEEDPRSVRVSTPFGDIEGFEHTTPHGVPIQVFLGIRYGQSPDVHLRFKKPELVEAWSPFLHHAKSFRAGCIPYHEKALTEDNFSEDCLFLNIITPNVEGKNLPVFVFIHGGGYEIGSSAELGYVKLANTLAAEEIVVVTIQYRLGPFGFFSLGDTHAPGNLGLWDQTLALHFLHQVLPSFGGSPSRITLAGHSAGSSSASAMLFSPHSNSLFSQALLMSGSALSEYALSDSVVEESRSLARELGCFVEENAIRTIDCLQMKTAEQIIQAVDKIGSTRRHTNFVKFHPRLDGDFFPHSIERLAKSASKKRTLAGLTDQEAALFVLYEELSFLTGLVVPRPSWGNFSRGDLVDFISTVVVTDHEHVDQADTFRNLLINFYVNQNERKGDSSFYLQRFIQLASDLEFLIPIYHELQIKMLNGWPSWLYLIDYHSPSFKRDLHPVTGAYHADELRFIVDGALWNGMEESDDDKEFGNYFVQIITNFVKKGDPSLPTLDWPPVSKEEPYRHCIIRPKPVFDRAAFRAEAARLWLQEVPSAVSGDRLRRSRLPGSEAHIIHTEL